MVTGTTITVSKQNSSNDNNDYESSFNLGLKATNGTTETLKWYLVRTQGSVDSLNISCSLQSEQDASTNATKYYYDGCTAAAALSSLGDGTLVGFGTITGNASSESLTTKGEGEISDVTNLAGLFQGEGQKAIGLTNQKLYTNGSKDTKDKSNEYTYYLIVEFPNDTNKSQNGETNANFNKEISVTFDEITNIVSKVIAE